MTQAAQDGKWGTTTASLNGGTYHVDSLGAGRWGGWDGKIDEFQFHGIARSDAWVATEYNQTSDPASFAKAGAPENIPVDPAARN